MKEGIIRLKNPKNLSERQRETLGVLIINWVQFTDKLSDTKGPGVPWKTAKEDNGRILYLVKKNPVTTSNQVKKSFKELDVSLSKSSLKKCLH